jgi:hypothetical protein
MNQPLIFASSASVGAKQTAMGWQVQVQMVAKPLIENKAERMSDVAGV